MTTETIQDAMQVCWGGHVITDVFASHPDHGANHCDRCGARTLSHCPTCGQPIPGKTRLPGMATLGHRAAPLHCSCCGAPFPWAEKPATLPARNTLAVLEPLLRRLPHLVRQLRDRHAQRATLRVADQADLEDLLRAVFHLHFDDVRRATRTPRYSLGTRTDFAIGPDGVIVAPKLVTQCIGEGELIQQVVEDTAHYERHQEFDCLIIFAYDLGGSLPNLPQLETALRRSEGALQVHCIATCQS